MKLIKEIYKIEEEISLPNAYEIWFSNQEILPTIDVVTYQDKLIFNLLINLDETQFSLVFKNLSNIGLELLDYLNSIIYGFTISIDDERVKYWLLYLYQDSKELYFVLWYLQYQFKMKKISLSIKFEDIPHFNFIEIDPYITYFDISSKKLISIFTKNNRGTTLL